jgi:predicted AAA+ superfamily ATPase
MEWYEELDFDENPFDTNPTKFSDKMVGVEDVMEDLIYRVNAGSIVFLEGRKGMGKSSILWNVIKRYRGSGRVIYVDCEKLEAKLNIEELIKSKDGFFSRLMGNMPRNMILLLDNVSELSKRNMERIKFFFDEGYIHSAIFTGEAYANVKFSKSLKDRIGRRVITLKDLEPYMAVNLIRNRIGDTEMISDELIEDVYAKSGKSPLTFLENMETLFSQAAEAKKDKITKEDLRSI